MAFFYYQAHALTALFPELYRLIKAERCALPPQTPQTIVIGNLDTESYLRNAFLERNSVLMGVEFPFLESAIENFSVRMSGGAPPAANQSWFSPATGEFTEQKTAGILELELAVLAVLENPQHAAILRAIGYPREDLNELKRIALAHKLALKYRDYLLHIPDTMRGFTATPAAANIAPVGALWRLVHKYLTERQYSSTLMNPDAFKAACKNLKIAEHALKPQLYLFGMPILSAFHIEMIAAIATRADVHLLGIDFANSQHTPLVHSAVVSRFAAYSKVLKKISQIGEADFSSVEIRPPLTTKQTRIEFWSLPGVWRGAEILGDHWHERLLKNSALRQTDIHAVLTNLPEDYAAFEKALSQRAMTPGSQTRLYEKSNPLTELMRLLRDAATSLDRDLILRYWANAAIKKAFNLDADKIELYKRALESAQGYRNDFPENQNVFNIDAALMRLKRGSLVAAETTTTLPSVTIREFEAAENLSAFVSCLDFLLTAGGRLAEAKGKTLFQNVNALFEISGIQLDPDFPAIQNLLTKISALGPDSLGFSQLVKILERYAPKSSLKQGSGKEGVLFSGLGGTCFVGESVTLFNLNEDLDQADQSDLLLPEYDSAPTRLTAVDAIYIALESARFSGCEELIYAWSGINPVSGAEKYPSYAVTNFRIFLDANGIPSIFREKFAATMLDLDSDENPPLAAAADAKTVFLITQTDKTELADKNPFLPKRQPSAARTEISVSDLENFLISPTHFALNLITPTPEPPAEFRNDEPKLGAGSKEQYRFCEDYLFVLLADTGAGEIFLPSEFIKNKQLSGKIPPAGFDQTQILLAQNNNDAYLRKFAGNERNTTVVVEYFFRADIKKTFVRRDAARLERRYLPAPVIGGITVTGLLGRFYERTDNEGLILLDSKIYSERSTLLVKMYLRLSLALIAAEKKPHGLTAISLFEYKLPESKTKQGVLMPEFSPSGSIRRDDIADAKGYLENLVATLSCGETFWFDLSLLSGKKLGAFTDITENDLTELLEAEPKGIQGEKADYLRRFYNLKSDRRSYDFFQKFILPVANLDTAAAKKKQKGKTDG
jgi:hypothetical protein